MKRKNWEIMVAGELADRFRAPEAGARFSARTLSETVPMLSVELREGWGNNIKSVTTWKNGKEVKS